MADAKISALTGLTAPFRNDLLPIVHDPSGSPATEAIALTALFKAIDMYSIVPAADFTLTAGSSVQSAFPTSGDVWTMLANTTYFFDGLYYISKSGTSCTIAMSFALGGSLTSILYEALGQQVAINTTGTTQSSCLVNQATSTVVVATGTTAAWVRFKGLMRTNASGTVTPQITFSATPTSPVMKANSYIRFRQLDTDTTNIFGDVG